MCLSKITRFQFSKILYFKLYFELEHLTVSFDALFSLATGALNLIQVYEEERNSMNFSKKDFFF